MGLSANDPSPAMTHPDLDERLCRILRFVVESHVQSAEPVGSQYVRAAYHLSISPATIRSAMQRLEALGLLDHPHTSAGRVPTEAGYRCYVDRLMEPKELPSAARRAIDAMLAPSEGGDPDPTTTATHALARASRHLALLACRPQGLRQIDRVELARLASGTVLLAIGGGEGDLPATSFRLDPPPDSTLLSRAETWIRGHLPVADPGELRRLSVVAGREAPPDLRRLLGDALERGARLLKSVEAPAVRIDGAEHIARQPEFQSAARLRALVTMLAERERLTRVLEPTAGSPRVRISIGHEIGSGALGECSVIATGVRVAGLSGSIGVLGPLRMPYPRLVSLVTYVSRRLAERA
jgi:heat-inducible transcriptional repressor